MNYLVFLIYCCTVACGITTNEWTRSSELSQFSEQSYILCPYCKELVQIVNKNIGSNKTFNDFKNEAIRVCYTVLDFKNIKGHVVCPGIIDSFGPHVLYIATQLVLDPEKICQDLNFCPQDLKDLPPKRTFLNLPYNNTANKKTPNMTTRKGSYRKQNGGSTFSVLQITDVHIDPHYTVGTPTKCNIFICCYPEFNGTGSAGQFGDYNCDLPKKTFDIILDAANDIRPKPAFVLFTGDSPPHDIWQQSWASQLDRTHDTLIRIREKLPHFNIYPAVGNHDSFPESLYYRPNDLELNYKTAQWWKTLFPIPSEQLENIAYSLYYTVLVKPGLRILSFNSDYGYTMNFYGLLNEKNPAYFEQIHFMEKTLHFARESNEKVILIGHVPPGDVGRAILSYGDFFTELVNAYSDVIVLTTFGHTHFDHFELVMNSKNNEDAVGVVLIAPSVTTEGKINPSFRVYHFDSDTFELVDYDQYFLNITEANQLGKATVKKLYSAKSEYNMVDLSPKSYLDLSNRFKTNATVFNQYFNNYRARNGLNMSCNYSCKLSMICKSRSTSLRDYLLCMDKN